MKTFKTLLIGAMIAGVCVLAYGARTVTSTFLCTNGWPVVAYTNADAAGVATFDQPWTDILLPSQYGDCTQVCIKCDALTRGEISVRFWDGTTFPIIRGKDGKAACATNNIYTSLTIATTNHASVMGNVNAGSFVAITPGFLQNENDGKMYRGFKIKFATSNNFKTAEVFPAMTLTVQAVYFDPTIIQK